MSAANTPKPAPRKPLIDCKEMPPTLIRDCAIGIYAAVR